MIDLLLLATLLSLLLIIISYTHISWKKIAQCYKMWIDKKYWTNYNIIEAISWTTKGLIIVPGLVFGIQIWWLYVITLCTSLCLIWASNTKLLPTLVAFNSLWVWLSVVSILKHFMM